MIVAEDLTRRYGSLVAVDGVSLRCEPGTVTGFLGPNGAGKSTTLRMVVGLTRPTRGRSTVLGVPYAELPNPGRAVGVLLDASAQHRGRSGREILTLAAMTIGVDTGRVPGLLERVGLDASVARKRFGTYSLGMRQRLGIAQALLGEPRVLVLDEPANGLDPEGIHWMRRLLGDFAAAGGTVLLSSHLLREVEAIADRLVVIGAGRVVAQGAASELLAGSGTVVRAGDPAALERALGAAGLASRPAPGGGRLADAGPEEVGQAAARAGVALLELRSAEGGTLEDLFLELTAPDRDAGAT